MPLIELTHGERLWGFGETTSPTELLLKVKKLKAAGQIKHSDDVSRVIKGEKETQLQLSRKDTPGKGGNGGTSTITSLNAPALRQIRQIE